MKNNEILKAIRPIYNDLVDISNMTDAAADAMADLVILLRALGGERSVEGARVVEALLARLDTWAEVEGICQTAEQLVSTRKADNLSALVSAVCI